MFLSYLRRHYKIIIMLAVFAAIFAGVFSLYELPTEAVGYSVALCLAAGAALFAVGYSRFRRKALTLRDMRESVLVSLDDLPAPSGAVEAEYQELLGVLFAARAAAESRAEEERRSAEDYYGLWAHQIKTPISAMRLMLQQSPSQENEALLSELFRVEQYVEMVLSYLRVGSESTDYVIRRLALDDVARGCIRKYARLFILKKISMDYVPTSLEVTSDAKWLAFVIEQVLSNALKYTPSGGSVRVYAQGSALVIADNGIGVRAEDLPRVFDKGFTGFNGREDRKSTGIGLYLCRRVCDALGHRIFLTSGQGGGASVWIEFSDKARLME